MIHSGMDREKRKKNKWMDLCWYLHGSIYNRGSLAGQGFGWAYWRENLLLNCDMFPRFKAPCETPERVSANSNTKAIIRRMKNQCCNFFFSAVQHQLLVSSVCSFVYPGLFQLTLRVSFSSRCHQPHPLFPLHHCLPRLSRGTRSIAPRRLQSPIIRRAHIAAHKGLIYLCLFQPKIKV